MPIWKTALNLHCTLYIRHRYSTSTRVWPRRATHSKKEDQLSNKLERHTSNVKEQKFFSRTKHAGPEVQFESDFLDVEKFLDHDQKVLD